MNWPHCTQRRLQHGTSPPEPLSYAQTRTETDWRHCACARQLNVNAASRLKTSHIQVRITPVFLLSSHVSSAYQTSVLCGGADSSSRRRLCVLNASLFHELKPKSPHINKLQESLRDLTLMNLWSVTFMLAAAATLASIRCFVVCLYLHGFVCACAAGCVCQAAMVSFVWVCG